MLMKEIAPEKSVLELCKLGDNFIVQSLKKFYKKLDKGVAFPTCINVNEVICHNSPLSTDTQVLKLGDVVRMDVGVHLDGYIAVAAHTVVLTKDQLTGKSGDVCAAAECALQVAVRLMKPGNKNTDVTKALRLVAENYGVNLCEGVLSHQLKRYVIDGSQVIILKPTSDQTVKEFQFKENEVYAIDVVFSAGEGKLRETLPRTTVYKRNQQNNYSLKLRSSRQVIKDIGKYNNLAFTLRDLDEKTAKVGIGECLRHGMVDAYPVLCEQKNQFVAHVKGTIFIQPKQTVLATSQKLQPYVTEKKVENKE